MKPYADSNFFVRLHLATAGYAESKHLISELLHKEVPPLPIGWLHRLEVANAFQYHVFLARAGHPVRVSPELAASALAEFEEDVAEGSYVAAAALPSAQVEKQFTELSLRHTARHGFRTYDLLHVSSALILGCDTFWTFDTKANKLAALEGLKTIRTKSR